MSKTYSRNELQVLRSLMTKYGRLTYITPAQIEQEYFALTGISRAHGCLYMASWRMEKGYYDSKIA